MIWAAPLQACDTPFDESSASAGPLQILLSDRLLTGRQKGAVAGFAAQLIAGPDATDDLPDELRKNSHGTALASGRKRRLHGGLRLVEPGGIEPPTSSLRKRKRFL